eukprot:TRINITY_DN2731_c0_g1_i1.p1 TRINITY_DN2731_c0_g1~~TRINITY_DN2731_c0_g1_i1.p1  ORF type:complete len:528 (-),score=6.88 TRINITY_DN2731_c0_g1_i1:122-1705(-)
MYSLILKLQYSINSNPLKNVIHESIHIFFMEESLAINASIVTSPQTTRSIKELTIDEAYELTGGHGLYQVLVAISVSVSQISCMFYLFCLPLFQTFPVIRGCPNGICETAAEACNSPTREYEDVHFNFITEFDLVCSEFKASLISSAFPIGFMLGSVVFSSLADSLGRLPTIVIGQSGMILSILVLVFFANFNVCLVCTGLCGFFSMANACQGYTFSYDSNHSRYVAFYATYVGVIFAVGELAVAVIMWGQVRWRTMCIIFMIFASLYVIFPLFLQEAPRYMYSKGKVNAAVKGFKFIAKVNGKEIKEKFTLRDNCKISTKAATFKEAIKLLFTKWVLVRFLLSIVLFFSSGFIYYGLCLNVQKFKGNVYLNAIINAIAEIIADITACVFATKLGLGKPLVVAFLLTAVSLVSQYLTEWSIVLSSISLYMGKFGISGGLTLIFMLAGKLFPTSIIATTIGLLGLFEKFGATLSPIVGNIEVLLFIMAIGCAFASSIISAFLSKQVDHQEDIYFTPESLQNIIINYFK